MADLFKLDDGELQEQSVPTNAPLAERLRPRALHEVVGQDHLVGADGSLTRMIGSGKL